MLSLPRAAVGTVQADTDLHTALWALIESLRRHGLQVQSFLSRACFSRYQCTAAVAGSNPRHLDSWLMSTDLCREIFIRGTKDCDLAVIEGEFDPVDRDDGAPGGRLEVLCDWLDLPRLAVIDASKLDDERLRGMAEKLDGLLLDRVPDQCNADRLADDIETRHGVPVLGTLGTISRLRAELGGVAGGTRPPRDLCEQLGQKFATRWSSERLMQLASRRGIDGATHEEFANGPPQGNVTIALAYDEAFNCYFPDTLDLLEARGATMLDFSPLRDELLPDDVDIVYIGCGHPECHADELSHNHCMNHALREHLRGGGRLYAEGGGLAYLCQEMEAPDGQRRRMAGLFPAIALYNGQCDSPVPVETALARSTWLAAEDSRLRGYRNPLWSLQPAGYLTSCVEQSDNPYDLVGNYRALGSLLHLDFAAEPNLLRSFLDPQPCYSDPADPWTMMT
jgi:cobyrinic acid a,c-diamide synthase